MTIHNAKITRTMMGREGHGIPTCNIMVSFDNCSAQAFGGYDLRHESHVTMWVDILDTLKLSSWEELPGTYLRIKHEENNGRITAIGHITEERWYTP